MSGRRLTVAYIANTRHVGGGARVLGELMTRLGPRFSHRIIVPGRHELHRWSVQSGFATYSVPFSGAPASRGRLSALLNAVALLPVLRDVDIVHAEAPTCFPGAALAARWLKRARVCHVQAEVEQDELVWCLRYGVDVVLTVFGRQASRIACACPSTRVLVVPNGVDVARFHPSAAGAAPRTVSVRSGQLVVTVANFSPVKGHPILLDAIGETLRQVQDVSFALAGSDPSGGMYQKQLQARALALGISHRVRFLEWQPDVRPLLNSANLFVLPSQSEAAPLSILEAMASGLPVVATAVGGVPELVIDGVTGLLVPPNDSPALAAAMVSVLTQTGLAQRLGAAGRARAEAHFSIERNVNIIAQVYDELGQRSH